MGKSGRPWEQDSEWGVVTGTCYFHYYDDI